MSGIYKILAKPLATEAQNDLREALVQHLRAISCGAMQVILVGSAARGTMTDQSDMDLLLVFETVEQLRLGRAAFYTKPFLLCPIDAVFMLKDDFQAKSKIGGLSYIAAREGRVLDL